MDTCIFVTITVIYKAANGRWHLILFFRNVMVRFEGKNWQFFLKLYLAKASKMVPKLCLSFPTEEKSFALDQAFQIYLASSS